MTAFMAHQETQVHQMVTACSPTGTGEKPDESTGFFNKFPKGPPLQWRTFIYGKCGMGLAGAPLILTSKWR